MDKMLQVILTLIVEYILQIQVQNVGLLYIHKVMIIATCRRHLTFDFYYVFIGEYNVNYMKIVQKRMHRNYRYYSEVSLYLQKLVQSIMTT